MECRNAFLDITAASKNVSFLLEQDTPCTPAAPFLSLFVYNFHQYLDATFTPLSFLAQKLSLIR